MTAQRTMGFTMIELILVMVLLGILSVSAISRFSLASFESATAAGELVEAIRYAQTMSMTHTGQDIDGDNSTDYYQIVISASGYTVSQRRSSDGVASQIVNPLSNASSYTRNWSNVILAPTITILFDGSGAPNLGATQTISVTVGSDTRTITIEEITGFIR
ncbi:MAG: type II secretion system protein [Gammaproteobacteria bacterium]|nr:type II secretion system protein [Gammaproteobacteria bacterium]